MEFPTFTQLQYFVAVARHGSFSAAAKTIPVTRQAVAKSIGDLENVLGVNLVAKEGNAQVLTPAGRELRPLAESIIVNVQALMAFTDEQGFTGNEEKVVLAVANESCRGEVLSESDLKALSRSIPGLTVQVERFDADACIVALETGIVDAALVVGEPRTRAEPLAIYRVSESRACIAVSATDELAKLDEVAIRQLEGRYVAIPANLSFLYQMLSQLCEREKIQIMWRRIGNGLDENQAFVGHGGVVVVVGENSKLVSDSKGIVCVPLGEGEGLRLPHSFVVRPSENKGLPMKLLQPIRQLCQNRREGS